MSLYNSKETRLSSSLQMQENNKIDERLEKHKDWQKNKSIEEESLNKQIWFNWYQFDLSDCISEQWNRLELWHILNPIKNIINIFADKFNPKIKEDIDLIYTLNNLSEKAVYMQKIFNPPPFKKDLTRLSVPPIISVFIEPLNKWQEGFVLANDIYLKFNKLESNKHALELDIKWELFKYLYKDNCEKVRAKVATIIDSWGYKYYDLEAEQTWRMLRWNSIKNKIYWGSIRTAEDISKTPFLRYDEKEQLLLEKTDFLPLWFHDSVDSFYKIMQKYINTENIRKILKDFAKPEELSKDLENIDILFTWDLLIQQIKKCIEWILADKEINIKKSYITNFYELIKLSSEFERLYKKLSYISSVWDIIFDESPFFMTIFKDWELAHANKSYVFATWYSIQELQNLKGQKFLDAFYQIPEERIRAMKKLKDLKPWWHYHDIFKFKRKEKLVGFPEFRKIAWDTHGTFENSSLRIWTSFLI